MSFGQQELMRKFKAMKQQLRYMPVQKKPCKTCPFAGEVPVKLHPERQMELTQNLVQCAGQHLCHSANNQKICRGGREIQLRLLCAMGLTLSTF